MELTVGKTYPLRNLNTRETAPFTVQEMATYKGCAVVYGETGRHGIRVYRGVRTVPARQGFFVMLPGEDYGSVLKLNEQLMGLPLVLMEEHTPLIIMQGATLAPEIRAYPVLNSGRIRGMGPSVVKTKDDMMMKGRRLIDVYQSWKKDGELPKWIIRAILKQKQGIGG